MSADLAPQILLGLTWFVVFLFSTTLHEAAHSFVAHHLGDSTAYQGGQVSLNPIPHIRREPVGMLIVPIVTYALRGWMMGWASAPFDPLWAQRYPRRAALMALAGPAANLSLVIVAGLLVRGGLLLGMFYPPERISFSSVVAATPNSPAGFAVVPLSLLFSLNLLLFLFNLLPLPPLDGSAALPLFMSDRIAGRYQEIIRQPMFSLLGLLVAWRIFSIDVPWLWALHLLYPGTSYH